MDEGLIVEGISFQGHCGVSQEERSQAQPLLVDLEFSCSATDAIQTDALSKTIDYAKVSSRVVDIGRSDACALLETLGDRISRTLLAEFPIETLRIWVRKANPPLEHVIGSVGVRLTYHRSQLSRIEDASSSSPSPFLLKHTQHIPQGRVLDLACGSGRHAIHLAKQGYEVVGLDRNMEALATLSQAAHDQHLPNLTVKELDLEANVENPPSLGENEYTGVVVFYYLYRPIFPFIIKAIKPGGILIYETFLIDNHHHYQHPRRKEFCLEHNELLQFTPGLRVLHYEEGQYQAQTGKTPAFTARLVAQKI
jgi:dihydroneopterin aldolase